MILLLAQMSPLNYSNTREDRRQVIGERSLNIADKIEFKRKVFQIIASTPYVELEEDSYKLSAKIKNSGNFEKLEMYAESGGKQKVAKITEQNDNWITIEIENVEVTNGKVEIGFVAHGEAKANCQVDDVLLVKN